MRSPPRCRASTGTGIPTGQPPISERRSPPPMASIRHRCSPPTARTRCCRRSCSHTPARAAPSRRSSRRIRCTRRSPGSLAQPSSRVSVLPTSRSTPPKSSGCSPNTARTSCSSRRRTIRQDSSSRPNVCASSSTSHRGWSWSTRRTRSSPTGRRSTSSARTCRSWSPERSRRRGRWPAHASAT